MRFDLLPFSPQLIQARWEFGKLPSEELPRLAQDALELGYDGKYTRRIAGLESPDSFDLQPLMPGFLAELGVTSKLSQRNAGMALARLVAQAIVDGRVKPYDGARFIWREIEVELWPNPPEELLCFVGNASEYEDSEFYSEQPEDDRKTIAEEIIRGARELAATAAQPES
ncbi:MAG TPA: hypothetical protein VN577_14880 [Terriglobales bacterium]|nr:hypothetical protein [Terriglobales bacterium]